MDAYGSCFRCTSGGEVPPDLVTYWLNVFAAKLNYPTR